MTSPSSRSDLPPPWMPDLDTLDLDHPAGLVVDGASADSDRRRNDRNGVGHTGAAAGSGAASPAPQPLLYTPADAAALLAVNESWLRRRAAARAVACTFLGKHLRFSPDDLHAIITSGAQHPTTRPTTARRRTGRRTPAAPTPDRGPRSRTDHAVRPGELERHPRAVRRRSAAALEHGEGVTSWRG